MSDFTTNVVMSHIVLFSADMDKTAEFYKAIGIRLQRSIHGWGPHYNYLDVLEENGSHVIFEIYPLRQGQTVGRQNLGFDVVDLPEVMKKLMEMGISLERPATLKDKKYYEKMVDHCTLATFVDPDGRMVTLTQHGKAKPA